jgi:hypothetical protein
VVIVADMFDKILGVALGLIFVTALVPTALENYFQTGTENWSLATVALWAVVAIVGVVAVIKVIYSQAK